MPNCDRRLAERECTYRSKLSSFAIVVSTVSITTKSLSNAGIIPNVYVAAILLEFQQYDCSMA